MSLGGRVPANADELRRENADIRGQLARWEAWRVGLRNMLARARETYTGDLARFADELHDAFTDELPDLTMRTHHCIEPVIPFDKRPTDRLPRTALGGSRPGLEEEDGA